MKKSLFSLVFLLLATFTIHAQLVAVKGTVISKTDNEPLIGATVVADGGKVAVPTDFDGNFAIEVPSGSNITVSFIGYKTAVLPAEPEMTIYLEEDSELLDEVVVVGYSVERTKDLTG
ncbi:MAG: carboxypeptidase-like regulatory domain-containing protein, partial [Muribaculaceae bacterium]|nr:carboxypeptidase-like regulatory domain-containing protein [Muribaculaceae bacterium]